MEWLGQQDFGRRCVLSVRDILSWVNFINAVCERDEAGCMTMRTAEEQEEDEEEAEWDLRLDAVTACVHAACLVYIDGLGSGKLQLCLSVPLGASAHPELPCRNYSVLCRRCPGCTPDVSGFPAAEAE